MEKRKHPRMVVRNMRIGVSDGIGCCSATVWDISREGLGLADLAKRFGKNTDAYTAVVSSENRHFKFRVRPKWERAGGPSKRVGIEISEPTDQWMEYVLSLEAARGQ